MKDSHRFLFAAIVLAVIAWFFYASCDSEPETNSAAAFTAELTPEEIAIYQPIWPSVPADKLLQTTDAVEAAAYYLYDELDVYDPSKSINGLPKLISGIKALVRSDPEEFIKYASVRSDWCLSPGNKSLIKSLDKGDIMNAAVTLNVFLQEGTIGQILDWLHRLSIAAMDCKYAKGAATTMGDEVFQGLSEEESAKIVGEIVLNLDSVVTRAVNAINSRSSEPKLAPLVQSLIKATQSALKVSPEGLITYLNQRDTRLPYCGEELWIENYGPPGYVNRYAKLPSVTKDDLAKFAKYLRDLALTLPELLPWLYEAAGFVPVCPDLKANK